MPKMNGFDSSKAIREFDKLTPIIALTSAVMDEDKILTKEAGMQEHLSKPIDFDELVKTICLYLPDLINIEKKEISETSLLLKHLDIDELLKRIGSEDLANELLEKFALTYKDFGRDLIDKFDDKDAFFKDIHKLKGVSGNLALKILYNKCVKIEEETNIENKKIALNEIILELKNVIKIILHEKEI